MQEQPTKILAVDDNPVARTVLQAFLKKSGYEPVIVEDAESALESLTSPEAPHIAILDWMMPGMAGTELCSQLRAARLPLRPYVIMLTARNSKADIAEALDAGADEFLSKPFNQIEMLARLRVAERMINYEKELQQRIDELAAMVERYRLLGDMIAKGKEQGLSGGKRDNAKPEEAKAAEEPGNPQIEAALRLALNSIGCGDIEVSVEDREGPYQQSQLTAWGGFYTTPSQVWLDFLLECDMDTGAALFEMRMRRKPTSDRMQLDFMSEILTLATADAKAELEARGRAVIAPYLSRGLRLGSLGAVLPISPARRQFFRIKTSGLELGLSLIRQEWPSKNKTAGLLNAGDILTEPFLPSEAYQIPLLNRGTILNDRYIERLISLAQSEGKTLKIPTIEPSPLAAHFNPVRKGHSIFSAEEE